MIYPESELARRHGAGVEKATPDPKQAYAAMPPDADVPYRDGWLPG